MTACDGISPTLFHTGVVIINRMSVSDSGNAQFFVIWSVVLSELFAWIGGFMICGLRNGRGNP